MRFSITPRVDGVVHKTMVVEYERKGMITQPAWRALALASLVSFGWPTPAEAAGGRPNVRGLSRVTVASGPHLTASERGADARAPHCTPKKRPRRKRRGQDEEVKPSADTPTPPATGSAEGQLPPPPKLEPGRRTVALLPIEGLDVTDDLLRLIEIALLREIDEIQGLEPVSPTDVQSDLEQYGLTTACEGDVSCMALAGRYARAHLAMETRVASLGGTLSVSLRLVDTIENREVARVADPVSENDKERAEELHRMAIQLLKPETYVGSLVITCSEPGAEVYLDDKLVGTTPLGGPLENLRAGPHILRLSKAGFSDLYRFVDVIYRRSSTINIDLTNTTIAGTIVEEVSNTGFGSLYVLTRENDVEIRIDGEPKGVTPLSHPLEKIAAGTRRLSLRKEGLQVFSQELEIKQGKRTDVSVTLNGDVLAVKVMGTVEPARALPALDGLSATAASTNTGAVSPSPPWSPGWRFFTGAAVAAVGLGGVILGSVYGPLTLDAGREASELARSIEQGIRDGTMTPEQAMMRIEELDRINEHTGPFNYTMQIVGYAAGAGLLVAGGALMLWDLFSTPSPPEAKTRVGAGPEITGSIAPMPGGLTGAVQVRF